MDKEIALTGSLKEKREPVPEIPPRTPEAEPLVKDAQALLLKAQKDAELARAVARQAISRAFKQSEASVKQAGELAVAFDNALQGATPREGKQKNGRAKKFMDGENALDAISDITNAFFHNKSNNAKTRREFYDVVIRQSKQLRELVDDLVWEQAQEIIDKAIEEAKSDRIASKLAVQQAREEAEASRRDAEEAINIASELVEQAKAEAAAEKKSAEFALSQARHQAVSRAEAEVKQARDEALAAKEAAGIAVRRAEDEVRRIKEEAEIIKRKLQETMVQARQQTYQDVCAELDKIKEEAGATKKAAHEAIARAQEESRKAREEADAVKKSAGEAFARAQEETRKAQEESEKARQSVLKMRLEIARIKEEAEASILMANETMKRARQDMIGVTIGEITRTRHELEAASRDPRLLLDRELSGLLNNGIEKPGIEKAPVSPQELITAAVQGAQEAALRNKNIIILSLPNTLPRVEADGRKIGEVLHNLITNAVCSSAEGNAITVRAEARDTELLVQVKDHGAGIPTADMPSIFDKDYPFGAGSPGLCACREIVEEHGGRIWVESLEGQGSAFSFTLPLVS